jgi:NAD(P)-dependent dehydrogenase (short-subunit alcohol dehydrogenase family)
MESRKVAIITGGSQGIGAGLVSAFRDIGYAVVANSRSIEASQDPDVITVAGDISDPRRGRKRNLGSH